MRLYFSECRPDYDAYLSPYQVWALLEPGESAETALAHGFLPGSYDLSHFYLARSVRVSLERYKTTGRIRYTAKQCTGYQARILPRREWHYGDDWSDLAATYLTERLRVEVFPPERFAKLLSSPLTTHVMVLTSVGAERPAGLVTMYLEGKVAYYGVAVYDLAGLPIGLGRHMMATALAQLREDGFDTCYLGSCYTNGSLYKGSFPGLEFFTGREWSTRRDELRFFVEHQDELQGTHLLEFDAYHEAFCPSWPPEPADALFRLSIRESTRR
ncbi:MAG: hypothetical protein ACRCSN_06040 [Dermatophilaceae bacterium]